MWKVRGVMELLTFMILSFQFGICVVMVTVTSVMNTADSGNFLTKSITLWGPEDVGEWVDGLGEWAHNYREIFIRQVSHSFLGRPIFLLLLGCRVGVAKVKLFPPPLQPQKVVLPGSCHDYTYILPIENQWTPPSPPS